MLSTWIKDFERDKKTENYPPFLLPKSNTFLKSCSSQESTEYLVNKWKIKPAKHVTEKFEKAHPEGKKLKLSEKKNNLESLTVELRNARMCKICTFHNFLEIIQTCFVTNITNMGENFPPTPKKKKKENTGYGKEFNLIRSLSKATQANWDLELGFKPDSWLWYLQAEVPLTEMASSHLCQALCEELSSVINLITSYLEAGMIITQLLLRKLRPRELKQSLKVHTGK